MARKFGIKLEYYIGTSMIILFKGRGEGVKSPVKREKNKEHPEILI